MFSVTPVCTCSAGRRTEKAVAVRQEAVRWGGKIPRGTNHSRKAHELWPKP